MKDIGKTVQATGFNRTDFQKSYIDNIKKGTVIRCTRLTAPGTTGQGADHVRYRFPRATAAVQQPQP